MKNRKRLIKKIIKKAYKIKYTEVQFISGFEYIPGYRFSGNIGPCDLEKYGYLDKNGYLKPEFVVSKYATDYMHRHYKGAIAIYRKAPNFEPDLKYFEYEVEQAKHDMLMFYDHFIIEPKHAVIKATV